VTALEKIAVGLGCLGGSFFLGFGESVTEMLGSLKRFFTGGIAFS
jgi:hypothetical protein